MIFTQGHPCVADDLEADEDRRQDYALPYGVSLLVPMLFGQFGRFTQKPQDNQGQRRKQQ
jgi:hypothetical protein